MYWLWQSITFSYTKSIFSSQTLTFISSYSLSLHSFHSFFCSVVSHVASEVLSVTDEDLTAISFLLDAEDEVRDVMVLCCYDEMMR